MATIPIINYSQAINNNVSVAAGYGGYVFGHNGAPGAVLIPALGNDVAREPMVLQIYNSQSMQVHTFKPPTMWQVML